MHPFILPLASASASLDLFGGKGRALANLAAAGLPIPHGFVLSTKAYLDFVEANQLQGSILGFAAGVTPHDVASADQASARIRSLFEVASLPNALAAPIVQAYADLGEDELARNSSYTQLRPAVAVRSSATAEDLPDLSFAGQQETYLNVRGEAELIEAIRGCWASLWTARALRYRQRMSIGQRELAMAVIIQVMVPADISGILFTANPSTGDRSEIVINASFGLGEAIVGGDVTPDTYVLDRTTFELKQTVIGTKEVMSISAGQQGMTTRPVPQAQRGESSTSAEILSELAALSVTAEQHFAGVPQDIEWAAVDGKCWLLQSRPITNLPPPPLENVRWDPPAEGVKLIRRQVVEHMPDPLSPLFDELYLAEGLEQSIDRFVADYRMPCKIEDFIERPMFLTVNGYAYCRASYRTWGMFRVLPKILFWYATSLRQMIRGAIPRWRDEGLPAYQAKIQQWKSVDLATATNEQLLSGVRALAIADAIYWFDVAIVLAMAKITDDLLRCYLKSWAVGGDLTSGMFLRGFPSSTLQAQEHLEAIARRIQTTESLRDLVTATPAGDLLEVLGRESSGHSCLKEIQQYLEQYGHQIYTLDFVQPTQLEDPLPVLLSLKALVNNEAYDTVARQAVMAQERELLTKETLESLGPLRRWIFKKLLAWAQDFGPHREQALFYVGAGWPTVRSFALELGRRLVEAGTFATPDDVFYLQCAELGEAFIVRKAGRARPDLGQLADRRRELREARKKLHPPGMVPEKSRFKIGPIDMSAFETQKRNADDSETLQGFAVSPGKVTGVATVIRSPAEFEQMKPDTILVCPTTTPAWTPLFSQATALVTDIGGILAHGSIVAREYGIPAVMGTGNVTQRIVTGQRITVDGDSGTVTILEQPHLTT